MGFATPTGKAELYSTIFEQLDYDPLPRHEEPHENPISNPELAKQYPLMLMSGARETPCTPMLQQFYGPLSTPFIRQCP